MKRVKSFPSFLYCTPASPSQSLLLLLLLPSPCSIGCMKSFPRILCPSSTVREGHKILVRLTYTALLLLLLLPLLLLPLLLHSPA
jgi:hypothetical protein